ncbi:hypothetical protein HPB48_007590 [Haemaphysalis longicornis]|uniref:BACK domain-containing protein n=1 Tax=Haemaphysalis longicornis TaxID=44386 RepID=A0A9J6FT79_HAELO|nr:hypothetical protein HPB48_007590 [Haemaphysalis longicornis]
MLYKWIVQRCCQLEKSGLYACSPDSAQHASVPRAPIEILFIYDDVGRNHKSSTCDLYECSKVSVNFTKQTVFVPMCAYIGHEIYVTVTDLNTLSPFCYCFDPSVHDVDAHQVHETAQRVHDRISPLHRRLATQPHYPRYRRRVRHHHGHVGDSCADEGPAAWSCRHLLRGSHLCSGRYVLGGAIPASTCFFISPRADCWQTRKSAEFAGTPRTQEPWSVTTTGTFDGGSVLASKVRLTTCGRYFDGPISGPMSKPRGGDFPIPGVSMESLQAIVTYCSTAHADKFQYLPIGAEYLLADNLRDACCAFISRNVDVDNSIVVLEVVASHHCQSPYNSADRFLLGNIELIYEDNRDFPKLSLTDLVDILLGSVEPKVRREELVWEAAVLWIKAIYKARRLPQHVADTHKGLVKGSDFRKVDMPNAAVNMSQKTIVWGCYDLKDVARPSDSVQFTFVRREPAEIEHKIYVTAPDLIPGRASATASARSS